ncbi:MAG: TVP38/TMEM64 family protein [Rhodospirillales bacterium]|nr:TVP38/TMEM64 family protein [Rhodospirillales bacterium]
MNPRDCRVPNSKADAAAPRSVWWRFAPVIVVALGFAAFFLFDLDRYLSFDSLSANRQALLAWRDENRLLAAVTFVAVYALAVAFSVPGAIWMTIAGGFLFGTLVGSIYAVVAATVGATAIFLAARYAFSGILRAKAGPAILKMKAGFRRNALSYLLALRLVPIFPFWLVNLVPAFLGVSLRTYVLGTFLGIIPGSVVYTLVGNGLGAVVDAGGEPDLDLIFAPQILAPIIGLALLSLLPVAYKRFRRDQGRGAP